MASECIIRTYKNMTEVLLRGPDNKFPEFQRVDQNSLFGGFAIGKFISGGTGFVISKELNKIIIATAAHNFLEDFEFCYSPQEFKIGGQTYLAYPQKLDLNWEDDSNYYIDPISGNPISIPEDWIYCELISTLITNTDNIVSLELADISYLSEGTQVIVMGFPIKLKTLMIQYVAPSASASEQSEIKLKLNSDSQLLRFDGVVLRYSDLICASCSTVNGMSGSPLLINVAGKFQTIGLLHGSRPSLLHYCTSRIMNHPKSPDLHMIQLLTKTLLEKQTKIVHSVMNSKISYFLFVLEESAKYNTTYDLLETLNQIYNSASRIEELSGNCASYNVFITSTLFKFH